MKSVVLTFPSRVIDFGRAGISPIPPSPISPVKSLPWLILSGWLLPASARANDSAFSELSHVAGNAVIAGATTVVVDQYYPTIQHPARFGFIVSASEALLAEIATRATGGKFSLLDVAAGTIGAAVGAYATHQWYIEPRVVTQKGDTTYGIVATRHF